MPRTHHFDAHLEQIAADLRQLPPVLTPTDLCRVFRISAAKAKQMRRDGEGPEVFFVGRYPRHTRGAVLRWVADRMAATGRGCPE
jgi:hypothetical protein